MQKDKDMSEKTIELTLMLMREEWYKQQQMKQANIEMLKAMMRG
ncbi:hypothetical protein FICEBENF_02535 [Aeromonas hydrophila]